MGGKHKKNRNRTLEQKEKNQDKEVLNSVSSGAQVVNRWLHENQKSIPKYFNC